MRRVRTRIAIALSTLLIGISLGQRTPNTTVPNLVRYGGTLKDATGAPIATAAGVTFAIYKQQDGGAAVWMETQNVTPDASGQYSVLLGSTTATGLPSDLFSQEEQRWLSVQVQGQIEQPRVLLVSVPYAFKAHEAETLAGRSISDFVLAKDANSANSAAGGASTTRSGAIQATSDKGSPSSSKFASAQGPTNFTGTTSDQIVSVVQSGTGKAIVAATSVAANTNAVVGTIPGAGVAILGHATSTSAQAYGIQGTSDSTIGIGLLGFATAATGSTYGLKGYSSSTGGTGVRGLSTATSGTTYGVSGSVSSPNGTAMWGQATSTNGGTGVWGQSVATTGSTVGVMATAASNAGSAIFATESSTTGFTYGVQGVDASPNGVGVLGANTANGGIGVYGKASAIGGSNVGVLGVASSPFGTGVSGSGSMIGVFGVAGNTAGVGGLFQNTSPQAGAKILVAEDPSGTSRFSVDTSGNVSVTTGDTNPVTVSLPVNHARLTYESSAMGDQYHLVTLTWAYPFPDTNYTATCSDQASDNSLWGFEIASVAGDSIVVKISTYGQEQIIIHCIGVHD